MNTLFIIDFIPIIVGYMSHIGIMRYADIKSCYDIKYIG